MEYYILDKKGNKVEPLRMNPSLAETTINRIFRYDIDTYHKLGFTGVLPRNTELIYGVVIYKMTISPIHSKIVTKLGHILSQCFDESYIVRQEKPITIGNSEPEPDISVIQGTYDDFGEKHPDTAFFVVEVAFSSLEEDVVKADIYASANISIYWILDLQNKKIEVFEKPLKGKYQSKQTFKLKDKLTIPLTNKVISLAELL